MSCCYKVYVDFIMLDSETPFHMCKSGMNRNTVLVPCTVQVLQVPPGTGTTTVVATSTG